jgi:hypothetical protein
MRLNLGPLHLLQSFAKETVEERGKEYFRMCPPKNLNLTSTSATIHNFRAEEQFKAHLPLNIWKNCV